MNKFAKFCFFTVLFFVMGFCSYKIGKSDGKIIGCQLSYRDLYVKYGIKNIDEISLLKFCRGKMND